ncbi:MAG TPA: hypothetical protein H9682_07755 [Firmicutes bacterium]|nr:hypothetical protein [Bacillota bacterium]
MKIEMSEKQFRRLLDMVYIGNWVLNSARGSDRIRVYDQVESLLFSQCLLHDMPDLVDVVRGVAVPSRAFNEGGIHEAIMAYEDTVFYEILAEELARRDMELEGLTAETPEGMVDLNRRIDEYLDEFELHGTDHITVTDME